MIREYKTIREISGPLMVVDNVQGVTYDELAEIELTDGSTRRCKVLEVNGDTAVVQLFEASAGINLAESKIRFWDIRCSWRFPAICWAVYLTEWASPSMTARPFWRRNTGISTAWP